MGVALGNFDPTGLHLALHWEDREGATYEARSAALSALLHERTHWLQFVGTGVGQFSAWLSALQTGLLVTELNGKEPLTAADLPLLQSSRVREDRKALWFGCERVYTIIFGGPRGYFELLDECSDGIPAGTIGASLRLMGDAILLDDTGFEDYQDKVAEAERFGKATPLLEHGDEAFGAAHLMEGAARMNELYDLEDRAQALDSDMAVDLDLYLFPPYSDARDLYFEITGGETGLVENELAFCVLADWALNCALPPLLPLPAVLGEHPHYLPGPCFVRLARALDLASIKPPKAGQERSTWTDEFTRSIYEQVSEAEQIMTPLQIAEARGVVLGGLDRLSIPENIYEVSDEDHTWKHIDNAARVRYLSILGRIADRTRLQRPGFFPLPHSYYSTDRKLFHEYWDPIQPPIISIGKNRLMPTVDDPGWFSFFFVSAIEHEIGMASADCDCAALGQRLAPYRECALGEPAEKIMAETIRRNLGDGEAAEAVMASAGVEVTR
jgi:hypothetical protein